MASFALAEFKSGLRAAEALVRLEQSYTDPPLSRDQEAVSGLRGGAAVLMVAALEQYLRSMVIEVLEEWPAMRRQVEFGRLPAEMQIHSVWTTLDIALKGPRGERGQRVDRLPAVEAAAAIVVAREINPAVFGETGGNPSTERVKAMFKAVGIPDVFVFAKSDFDRRWTKDATARTASTFIENTLQAIVDRRHSVAHTGSALNISRQDLRTALKFLRAIGDTLDRVVAQHMRKTRRAALG